MLSAILSSTSAASTTQRRTGESDTINKLHATPPRVFRAHPRAVDRYDHHQRGFEETLNEDSDIKLSSAGLVFKHFGRRVISVIVGPEANDAQLSLLEEKLYKSFVREIDAIDNGIEIADEKRYSINTNLSSRVGRVNPAWNEDTSDDVVNAAFKKAVFMTASEFIQVVLGFWTRWMPARSIVEEAFDSAASVHESGKILKLARFCPWKGHLFDIEKEREISEDAAPLYVLFMDSSGAWRVQCVPSAPTGFENRKSLPEPWRGVRDDELSALSGIDGCIFVREWLRLRLRLCACVCLLRVY